MTDEYVEILSKTAYQRLLFMRAGVASVFSSSHKYKLHYLTAKRLIILFDRFADVAVKSEINEPVKYFKKMLVEFLDEQMTV